MLEMEGQVEQHAKHFVAYWGFEIFTYVCIYNADIVIMVCYLLTPVQLQI